MTFVTAYSKATGREHFVPEEWFDSPELCRDLTLDPPPEVVEAQAEAEEAAAAAVPSLGWTREELDEHATQRGIDISGAKNKSDVLAAIEAAPVTAPDAMGADGLDNPALTAIGTAVTPPGDPTSPSTSTTPTTSTTETPAAGETQE